MARVHSSTAERANPVSLSKTCCGRLLTIGGDHFSLLRGKRCPLQGDEGVGDGALG
jgi:hypothetical protein